MDSSHETRAGKLLDQVNQGLGEENLDSGLPEFHSFPKLLRQYAGTPRSLKIKPANAGHVMALAEAYGELAAEIEELKKSLRKL